MTLKDAAWNLMSELDALEDERGCRIGCWPERWQLIGNHLRNYADSVMKESERTK